MPRMRPWKLCRFFADGGGVRHGGKGWCLREWIPHHAGRARGGSIAKRARFTHSMLLQGGAGRRPTRISALEKGDARGSGKGATQRRSGSRRLGAGRCAPLAPRPLPLRRSAAQKLVCEVCGRVCLVGSGSVFGKILTVSVQRHNQSIRPNSATEQGGYCRSMHSA